MANQEQNPPQQEQPFVAAKQVSFNLEDIILNTNNEVALLYPEHTNKDYFKCVFDFISKYCLRKPFTRYPNMYKEYLGKFWYSAVALENSKVSFSIPTSGSGFPLLDIGKKFLPKELSGRASFLLRWRFTNGIDIQCLGGKSWSFDQLTNNDANHTPSSNAERVPQGTKLGAKPGHKKHSTSSKQPSVSTMRQTKCGPLKHPTSSREARNGELRK
ncbi:hypothetical protein Tco_0751850 [Tanacetum coccineum]|uniref:Uncharacterized protein n=1 Tax=Tanacetum coccineum TaxID=301880 RepID=A0ABQ4Z5B9_9ASTR